MQNRNKNQFQFFKAIARYKKSHHMPIQIPKSFCATVSAALSTAIDHTLDSDSNNNQEKLPSFALLVLGIPVSTCTEQAPRKSLMSLLRKNVKNFKDFNLDVFSTVSPEFSKLHSRTSSTRTYQSRLKASARAKLIKGDISVAL